MVTKWHLAVLPPKSLNGHREKVYHGSRELELNNVIYLYE